MHRATIQHLTIQQVIIDSAIVLHYLSSKIPRVQPAAIERPRGTRSADMAKNIADSTDKHSSNRSTGKSIGNVVDKKAGKITDNGTDKGIDKSTDKSTDLSEEFMLIDPDSVEFDSEEETPPPLKQAKDPSIRRKIEDLLERKRLREELGIYDDEAWEGL
jgi:hypothetical protein